MNNPWARIHVKKSSLKSNADEVRLINKIMSFDDIFVFSPHLDDAILSLGSLLLHVSSIKKRFKIINFFTKGTDVQSAYTDRVLKMGRTKNSKKYFERRNTEDAKAILSLKTASRLNLGLTDAAWRMDKHGLPLYEKSALGMIHPGDKAEKDVRKALVNLSNENSKPLIFAPLGNGKHVDHQIVRNVATKLFDDILFYSDVPYTSHYEKANDFIKKHKLSKTKWRGDQKAKKNLVLIYSSQLTSLLRKGDLYFESDDIYFSK